MKTNALLAAMLAIFSAASGAAIAAGHDCPERARCTHYGPPPIPPIPPMAPVPPIPPMPPLPPEPPPMPAIPDSVHAACAGKPVGSKLMMSPSRGETWSGVCKKDSKGMYFQLRTYSQTS